MLITTLPNGNLKMTPTGNDSYIIINRYQPLPEIKSEQRYIRNRLACVFLKSGQPPTRFKSINPEDCGALTAAPLITDGKDVWGYMDYQVKSFLVELAEGREIIWQKG
jgi:hypothetical protein